MKVFLVLCAVAVATAVPVSQEESVPRLIAENFVNCMNSDLSLCFKEQALKVANRLGTVRKLKIFDGLTIYNNEPSEGRSFDSLPSDPDQRSKQITENLIESTSDLMSKSVMEISFPGGEDDDEDESRALDDAVQEGRGKKKKQLKKKLKLLIPLAILGKIKAIALVVLALLVIAASLFKLALLAKIAFIAKVIAIIKALIAKKHSQEEHTWVTTHEEHPPSHGGWDGGWSRSRNEAANSLAYSAYQN